MKHFACCAFAAALLLAGTACSDGGTVGECYPQCIGGKVCKDGRCVTPTKDGGGVTDSDGGVIIDPNKPDGGANPTADAGPDHCAAETTSAKQQPLDMFIMFDQSGSMLEPVAGGQTRWAAVAGALRSFLAQGNLDGMSVGIQYFGQPDSLGQCVQTYCEYDDDCGSCGPCGEYNRDGDIGCIASVFQESCNPDDYSTADVEIAALPGVATLIDRSITDHSPDSPDDPYWGTMTPTSAALQGAINHAHTWAQSHPQHVVIALLATDGEPTECDTNISHIRAIAAGGVSGTPKVRTFVIGVGTSLTNLNGIANSGGTGQAFLVNTSGDVNAQFIAALNQVRGAALGCTYQIPVPSSGTPDFGKVNVQYTPGAGGAPQTFVYVQSKAQCPAGKDAWYYDNPSSPNQIIFCDSTCTKVKADTSGSIDVLLGCSTIGPN
ncbi:MAG: hypothetical protein HY901_26190 [Deltaproteobacteria bacterium]|nr:hypothetical protein [Deltaproteobacteria bacterium]